MLTFEQVRDLARAEGLAEHGDALVAAVRPGWRLELAGGRPAAVRLGGDPDLAPGESWPVNRRGVPMTYLAHLEPRALPPIDPAWADRMAAELYGGPLRVFADLLDNPIEPGVAAVLHASRDARLHRTAHPDLPDPLPPGGEWDHLSLAERFWRLDERLLAAVPFLTAPEYLHGLREDIDDFSELADRYAQFAYRLRIDGAPNTGDAEPWAVCHVLGEPSSVQDDARGAGAEIYGDERGAEAVGVPPDPTLADEHAWQVLLALHTDDRLGLSIHDGGALHVVIPASDLAAGRFDRLACDVASS